MKRAMYAVLIKLPMVKHYLEEVYDFKLPTTIAATGDKIVITDGATHVIAATTP